MWCHNCGQDVPRVAFPESGKLCCLRCGKPVGQGPSAQQTESAPCEATSCCAAISQIDDPLSRPSGYDGWETDEHLKHVGRLLAGAVPPDENSDRPDGQKQYRVDAAHSAPSGHHLGRRSPKAVPSGSRLGTRLVSAIAATMLMLGLMAVACGGVLLGWSAVMRRDDLWTVGLPITVAGLIVLLVALVLQLDRLSGDHRETVAKLEGFDSRLYQIRRDAAMTKSEKSTASDAFYSHWTDGGSPQLLLTDLKSQLDLLTRRLVQADSDLVSSDGTD